VTRQERFYMCAFVVTNVAVGGFALAMGLAMYDATGSATAFGAMVGLESLIGIGGQFLGGSFLDRRNVLRIAIAGNSTRGLAIGLGAVLGRQLPEKAIKIGAAVLFLVFGVLLILDGVTHL
jgi:hypothetical protein